MIQGLYTAATIILAAIVGLGVPGIIAAVVVAPAVVQPIIATFTTKFLNCKLCIVVVTIALTSIASYWIGREGEYDRGVNDTIAGIARADAKLVDRATKAREKLKDCEAQGKTWVQSTGACR